MTKIDTHKIEDVVVDVELRQYEITEKNLNLWRDAYRGHIQEPGTLYSVVVSMVIGSHILEQSLHAETNSLEDAENARDRVNRLIVDENWTEVFMDYELENKYPYAIT